jgi:hypothetical protein
MRSINFLKINLHYRLHLFIKYIPIFLLKLNEIKSTIFVSCRKACSEKRKLSFLFLYVYIYRIKRNTVKSQDGTVIYNSYTVKQNYF